MGIPVLALSPSLDLGFGIPVSLSPLFNLLLLFPHMLRKIGFMQIPGFLLMILLSLFCLHSHRPIRYQRGKGVQIPTDFHPNDASLLCSCVASSCTTRNQANEERREREREREQEDGCMEQRDERTCHFTRLRYHVNPE